jgi:outer membrane protein assembly factor BamB
MAIDRRAGWGVAWAVVGLCATAAARGDDWPQWLGPRRDGVWRETGILEKFPEGGVKARWRAPVSAGYAGPAVAEGKVFLTDRVIAPGAKDPGNVFNRGNVPSTERVHCFNEADGKLLWTHEYDCPYTVSYPLGPRTTPSVAGGKVYTLGAEGNLFCLDVATGKVLWSHDLKKEYQVNSPLWGYSSHLLVDGDKVFSMVGGEGTAVVAFHKDSGKEVWRALSCKDVGYCPPMIYEAGGKRQLIAWHGEAINGLDPETGQVYWTEPAPTNQAMSISTPRKQGNDLFLTAVMNTAVMLRLASDKPAAEVVWRKPRQQDSMHSCFATPFFEGGHVYGCTNYGELVCINAETGERVWGTLAPNDGQKLSSADVFLIKNGDRFFLFTEKGDLIIARLSPKGYEEDSRTHLLDPTSKAWGRPVLWSHPAFANRSIYLRNDKELICVPLAAAGGQ